MREEDIPKRISKKVLHDLVKLEKEQRILRYHESEYSVFEEVFDKSTLMTLYDIMNANVFSYLNGVVASGKESRVYCGVKDDNTSVAVKIYLVASSDFKHRLQYIAGDPRFGSIKKGMRNIVNLWARKEFKNLQTAHDAEVPVPQPIYVKSNILVMQFIGDDGVPAPTLNLCEVTQKHYREVLKTVSQLYKAGLVHADLSAYNIFLHKKNLVLFDFGSAVDVSHPNTKQFLSRDISNINKFFSKNKVEVYGLDRAIKLVKKA
ncbi:MAG: serine protein kinase RIO [Nitrososphaerales archaeon]